MVSRPRAESYHSRCQPVIADDILCARPSLRARNPCGFMVLGDIPCTLGDSPSNHEVGSSNLSGRESFEIHR